MFDVFLRSYFRDALAGFCTGCAVHVALHIEVQSGKIFLHPIIANSKCDTCDIVHAQDAATALTPASFIAEEAAEAAMEDIIMSTERMRTAVELSLGTLAKLPKLVWHGLASSSGMCAERDSRFLRGQHTLGSKVRAIAHHPGSGRVCTPLDAIPANDY